MCGRYTLAMLYDQLAQELQIPIDLAILNAYRRRYNIAPTDQELIVRFEQGALKLIPARFGLVNHWAKDTTGAAQKINARAESIREKPAFREAFERRRVIVPADGFYEWQRAENTSIAAALEGRSAQKSTSRPRARTPFWFHPKDEPLFRFAGISETWRHPTTGETVRTFAIITTAANDVVANVHHRMPALIAKSDLHVWLTGTADDAFSLLRPAPNAALIAQRASPRVGNVRNDDASLLSDERDGEGDGLADFPLFNRKPAS